MAGSILKNAQVRLQDAGSTTITDFSAVVRRVRINETYDLLDDTHMGLNSRSRQAGLIDWRAEVDFLQSWIATTSAATYTLAVDKKIGAIYTAAQPVDIYIRPYNADRSSDNPEFSGKVILETFNPVDGEVGTLQIVTASFRSAGDLTRDATTSS